MLPSVVSAATNAGIRNLDNLVFSATLPERILEQRDS